MNNKFLTGFCTLAPGIAMLAAHWFPWRKALGRKLHRPEAYAIGTAAITGSTVAAIAVSTGDKNDHARYALLSAASAGMATLAAWALDAHLDLFFAAYESQRVSEVSHEFRQNPD